MTDHAFEMIKNPEGLSLEELLNSYKKSHLLDIGESLAVRLPKSWKKGKLTEALADKIVEQAQTIYNEVLEQVIDTLPDKEQTVYQLDRLDSIKGLAPLIRKGFFFAAETDEGYLFIIPSEVVRAVDSARGVEAPLVPELLKTSESDREPLENVNTHQALNSLNKWKNQLISIYGSYTSEHLHSIWNRYYKEELTIEEIEKLLSE
ncbi:MAG: hypothetical protein JJU16_03760 [Alkalibacterium sp.]|nr:hypothetical protein [Alkalibacterium sp.]